LAVITFAAKMSANPRTLQRSSAVIFADPEEITPLITHQC